MDDSLNDWGSAAEDPVYVASRQTLSRTASAHASPLDEGASAFPDSGNFPQYEDTEGLTQAASEISVKHKLFIMDNPEDVKAYEGIQSKAMMSKQRLTDFQVKGKMIPEGEYYSVLVEGGNWDKEGYYKIALKYCIIKVTHRMGNRDYA